MNTGHAQHSVCLGQDRILWLVIYYPFYPMTVVSPPSAVEQINLYFDSIQDRLVLRLGLANGELAVFWLSRRLTRLLLPAMVKLVSGSALAADDSARRELMAYEHRQSVDGSDFSKAFNDAGRLVFPDGPVLIMEVKMHVLQGDQGWRLDFISADGKSLSLNTGKKILHSLIKLFNDVLPHTGWDVELAEVQGALDTQGRVMH